MTINLINQEEEVEAEYLSEFTSVAERGLQKC